MYRRNDWRRLDTSTSRRISCAFSAAEALSGEDVILTGVLDKDTIIVKTLNAAE